MVARARRSKEGDGAARRPSRAARTRLGSAPRRHGRTFASPSRAPRTARAMLFRRICIYFGHSVGRRRTHRELARTPCARASRVGRRAFERADDSRARARRDETTPARDARPRAASDARASTRVDDVAMGDASDDGDARRAARRDRTRRGRIHPRRVRALGRTEGVDREPGARAGRGEGRSSGDVRARTAGDGEDVDRAGRRGDGADGRGRTRRARRSTRRGCCTRRWWRS